MKETTLGRDQRIVLRDSQVLITGDAIARRVDELAHRINATYDKGDRVAVVGVLKGSLHFLSDLTRRLTIDQRLEFIRVSTYLDQTSPVKQARPETFSDFNLRGQDVLVVDDILDQGYTVRAVRELVRVQDPRSLRWAILLVKDGSVERSGVRPDFIGFEIPDTYVVGYGLDYGERYRNLPDIYAFEQGPPE